MLKIHQDEAQMPTDTVQSLWWLDAEMLSVVPREGASWDHSRCRGRMLPPSGLLQTHAERCFRFLPFFVKENILFRLILVMENRY